MFKKIMAGAMLAALSVTAIIPAAASAAPGTTIVDKAIAVNSRTGNYDTLLTAATCDYLDGAVVGRAVLSRQDALRPHRCRLPPPGRCPRPRQGRPQPQQRLQRRQPAR